MKTRMSARGYSGTPLWKKLGFKPGMKLCVIDPPAHYEALFADAPRDWLRVEKIKGADAFHCFIIEKSGLKNIAQLAAYMPPATLLWMSWPKKTSPLSKGLSEDDIRAAALAADLVDIKVCAIDENWSGLRLAVRISKPVGKPK